MITKQDIGWFKYSISPKDLLFVLDDDVLSDICTFWNGDSFV